MSNQETDRESIPLDTTYDLLAHRRRRRVLGSLDEHGALTLADLADEIACRERDAPIDEIPEEAPLRVYSSLWHVHVPKLVEAGVVAYDQDRDVVTRGENASVLERVASVEPLDDEGDAV